MKKHPVVDDNGYGTMTMILLFWIVLEECWEERNLFPFFYCCIITSHLTTFTLTTQTWRRLCRSLLWKHYCFPPDYNAELRCSVLKCDNNSFIGGDIESSAIYYGVKWVFHCSRHFFIVSIMKGSVDNILAFYSSLK